MSRPETTPTPPASSFPNASPVNMSGWSVMGIVLDGRQSGGEKLSIIERSSLRINPSPSFLPTFIQHSHNPVDDTCSSTREPLQTRETLTDNFIVLIDAPTDSHTKLSGLGRQKSCRTNTTLQLAYRRSHHTLHFNHHQVSIQVQLLLRVQWYTAYETLGEDLEIHSDSNATRRVEKHDPRVPMGLRVDSSQNVCTC